MLPAPWFLVRSSRAAAWEGLRPTDVRRDLVGITELVGLAFRDELRSAGRNPDEELWMVRRGMPIAWLLATLWPRFREAFMGFVWIAEGRVVGNVSLTRIDRSGRHWMIGNVAVHPDYRRRGIARRLTERALAHCRARGADRVSLEVRRGNTPAQNLYLSMGFKHVDSQTKLELASVPNVVASRIPGVVVRRAHPGDVVRIRRLGMLIEHGVAASVGPGDSEPAGVKRWLFFALGLLSANGRLAWLAERNGCTLGYVSISPGPTPVRRLKIVVHPAGRGVVESVLVASALEYLRGRHVRVRTEARPDLGELIEALEAHGFEPIETLDRMTLDL